MKWRNKARIIIILIVLALGYSQAKISSQSEEDINIVDGSWGLFKPHLLFCLTQRSLNPLNFGLIYTNHNKFGKRMNPKTNLRWRFGNSRDMIFVDYTSNNGYDFAEQIINDKEMLVDIQMTFAKQSEHQWGVNLRITNKQEDLEGLNAYLYLSASSYEMKQVFSKIITIHSFQPNSPIKLEIEHLKSKLSPDYLEIQEDIQEGEQPSIVEIKLLQKSLDEAWRMQDIMNDNLDKDGSLLDSEKLNVNFDENSSSCASVTGGTIRNCKDKTQQKRGSTYNNISLMRISNSNKKELNFFIRFNNSTLIERYQNDLNQKQSQYQSQSQQSNTTQKNATQVDTSSFISSSLFNDSINFEKLIKMKKDKFKLDLKQKFGYEKEDLIQSSISNLLGGIVFYHGQIVIRNSLMKNTKYRTVFSASPSRKIFPRAFLWDEGFHDSIICVWNEQLCKQFLHSWLQNQDIYGYIAREQVRTTEISSQVPDGFRSQDAYEANPPTLLLPILQLTSGKRNLPFLQRQFRKLEKWFKWFTKTQSGLDFHNRNKINRLMFNEQLQPHYRWQCKGYCNDGNFMGSGLDDYPRQSPFTISKQHLDLQSWMIFFSESLETLSYRLNDKVKYEKYGHFKRQLIQQLSNEFLDKKAHLFKDIGVNHFNHTQEMYITHLGYITVFPLLFNAIPINSTEFLATIDLLSSREHLWTDYGIRSLSLKDPQQETGDNYWRGAIWMPLNYMILRSLKLNYFQNERARTIYHELRDNLIQNIYKNWKQSGYLYETYNPKTGQGQRGYPFNGWTSLIVLIIKQEYE